MRSLSTPLIQSLMEEEPFRYAHLVKFEKPIKTESGKPTKKATSYSYITDASIDISYDDGSVDVRGTANGVQTYVANRLLDVSGISETIEARASNFSITIGASALRTSLSATFTIAGSGPYTLTSNQNLVEAGFLEGDEIYISGGSPGWTARIDRFVTASGVPNATAYVTLIEGTVTSSATNILLNTKDIGAILLPKTDSSYARYINREIFVYKAHISVNTGAIIGNPFLLFKGIITSGSLTEDVNDGSKMVWNISSHWGDWVRVNGRVTSDSHHRALNNQGFSDREALVRPEYADDLGFLHSEQALNIMAVYKAKETRYKMKKSGLFGLKVKMKEIQVLVDREVDLRFNLEAKYLPVVYGVQRLDTIPFFVDTDANDPSKVYVAYALCEGEIAGIYDIYFGDQSSVCLDANDYDTRSSAPDGNIDVLCSGRADRGDVLKEQSVYDSTFTYADQFAFNVSNGGYYASIMDRRVKGIDGAFSGAVQASPTSSGILHEKGRSFTDPIDARFVVHTGKKNQAANSLLSSKAQSSSFKVQGDYYDGDKSQYWGPNHRVLDTAYVVAEFTLSEGEEELPEVEFIVKGKLLECYNYDYSYIHDPASTYSAETTASFQIGDIVTLKRTDTSADFNTAAVVADIYTDELGRTRVRFLDDPLLPVENFYIAGRTGSPGDPDYHLVSTNYVVNSGSVAATLKQTITSTSPVASSKTYSIAIGAGDVGNTINLSDPRFAIGTISPTVSINTLTGENAYKVRIVYGSSSAKGTGSTTTDIKGISSATAETTYTTVISKNGIKLAAGASATNDFYNGYVIELTRTNTDGSTFVQTRNIIDYDGTNKIALVDEDWDAVYFPVNEGATVDTYSIYAPDDSRVSNNPAIQLLDYITSERYGRGLSLDDDINIESFKEAARKCDTRSDVTVVLASGSSAPTIGDIYQHTVVVGSNTVRLFRGTVSEAVSTNGLWQVTFTDVIGKLGKKWFDWKSYTAGDLLWHNTFAYRVTVSGTIVQPNGTGALGAGSVTLTRITGGSTLTLDLSKSSFDGNPLVKKYVGSTNSYISGYSLYDCDDVKYWRYVGWNAQDQNYVTRHQTNVIVNTSNSVFDNINMLLGHFNGILRYNAGKYEIDVESQHVATEAAYGYNEITTDITTWTTVNATISAGAIAGPVGGSGTVVSLTEAINASSVIHSMRSQVYSSIPNNNVLVASAYIKAGTYSAAGLRVNLKSGFTMSASFQLTGNGAYKNVTGSTPLAAGIYLVGDGWYRCWVAANIGSGGTNPTLDIVIDNNFSADSSIEYVSATATNNIYVSTPKVEFYRSLDFSSGPTPYLYYPNIITEEDIIGAISIEDPGNKETYNTISIDIPDPRNRFEERSVTYFNSTYLVEDNNVPKKGDMKATGITNYFNARLNAKQYLEQSRYGLKINFTMPPKGLLITAGSIIEITNSRLGFVSKPFRVTNLTVNKDCLVQINADEHTNAAYLVAPSSSGAFASSEPSTSVTGGPEAVSALTASTNQNGSIILSWTAAATFNSSTDSVEIYRSTTSSFGSSSKIAVVGYTNTFTDVINVSSNTNYWYWARVIREAYKKATNSTTALFSAYYPLTSSTGVQGTSLSSLAVIYDVLISAPVIFKDASTVGSPGTHTNISVSPTRIIGTSTSPFGFVTVTGNGDTEATTASPTITTTISNSAGKSNYTVRMYDTSTKINLLDSQVVPVVLKGDAGTSGTNPITAAYTNEAHVVPVTTAGLETWTNSGGLFYVYEGISPLTLNSNTQSTSYPSVSSPSQYNLDITFISGSTLTEPNITGAGTTTGNISPWAGDLAGVTSYRLTAYIRSASGATVTRSIDATIAPSNQGATGADAVVYAIDTTAQVIFKDAATVGSPGTHTTAIISGTRTIGSVTSPYGFVTVTGNGDAEASPAQASITLAPITTAGKTSYTVSLYNQATITGFSPIDTQSIPVIFKGATGASGVDPVVYAIDTTAQVIFKDAANAATSGTHTTAIISGTRTIGSVTSPYGFVTVTGNGDAEASPAQASITLAPASGAGKTSYTVKLYNQATITSFSSIDTQVIPIVFKGAPGTDPVVYAISTTAPVIVKDAATSGSPGVHTNITVSGTRTTGSVTSPYGFVTITGNGDAEASPAAASITTSISNTAGKTSYTVNLYNQATITGFSPIDSQVIPIVFKGTSGADGTTGANAITAVLSNEAHVFPASNVGAVSSFTGSGTQIRVYEGGTLLTYSPAGTGNGMWAVSTSPINITVTSPPTNGGTVATYVDYSGVAAGTDTSTIEFNVTGKTTTGVSFTASKVQKLSKSKSGTGGITATLSNEAHVFPASNIGAVTSYTGSGTQVRVYEGGTLLTYSPAGTANGMWAVSSSPINITVVSPPANGGTVASYGDYTTGVANGTDTSTIEFNITGKTTAGTSFTASKIQSFSKSKTGVAGTDPVVYAIDTTAQVIFKDAATVGSPGTHTTAILSGTRTIGSVTSPYGFVTVTGNGDAQASPAQASITLAPTTTAGKTSYTVNLYNQATITGFSPIDTQVIPIIFKGTSGTEGTAGANAITAVLSNEAHVFPASNIGAVTSYTGSGSQIRVYEGGSLLTYSPAGTGNGMWAVSTSPVNITVTSPPTNGGTVATYGNHSAVANGTDTSSVEFNVTGKTTTGVSFTASKVQKLSKSKSGTGGVTAVLSNEAHVFPATTVGAVTSYTGSGTQVRVYEGGTLLTYSPAGTGNGMWAVSTSPVNITVTSPPTNGGTVSTYADYSGVANGTDTSTIEFNITGKTTEGTSFSTSKRQNFSKSKTGTDGAAGANSVVAVLSKDSHVFPASPDGTVTNYTGAGTEVRVYEGATELVYSPAATKNGRWTVSASPINITIPTVVDSGTYATYNYTTGVAAGTDTSSASYTITGKTSGGTSFTLIKVQSFSKSKIGTSGTNGLNGSPAVSAILTRPSASVTAYANGVVKASELPIGGTFKIYKGSTDVTTSATFSSTVSPAGGLTGSVSPSGATAGIYNITAVSPTIDSGSLNLSAVYEGITYTAQFSISKNRIGFEIVSSPLPTTDLFEGRMVFLSDNDKLYRYTGTAWTAAVDGGDISPGTLAATAFATNIKPVEIVSSPLPTTGLVDGRIVFLTDDKKLYRYSASPPIGWTKSTDGADIIANSITAGQIQAGAIGATQIAAGAITTNKLVVSSSGFNLTRDPAFSDSTAWYKIEGNGAGTFESSPALSPPFGTTFAKTVNSTALASGGAAFTMGQSGAGNDRPFSATAARRYKVSVWIRSTSASSTHYVRMYWYDSNTTLNTTSATLTAVSPNITGSENFTLTAANTWQRFTWYWDAPTGAVSCLPRIWGGWNALAATSYFNDFRVEEFIGGELVVDGTIKGSKIEALTITANEIAVGTITTAKIATNQITAALMQSDSITARELTISMDVSPSTALSGIFMDSTVNGPKIDIYDAGVLRIRLGRLS